MPLPFGQDDQVPRPLRSEGGEAVVAEAPDPPEARRPEALSQLFPLPGAEGRGVAPRPPAFAPALEDENGELKETAPRLGEPEEEGGLLPLLSGVHGHEHGRAPSAPVIIEVLNDEKASGGEDTKEPSQRPSQLSLREEVGEGVPQAEEGIEAHAEGPRELREGGPPEWGPHALPPGPLAGRAQHLLAYVRTRRLVAPPGERHHVPPGAAAGIKHPSRAPLPQDALQEEELPLEAGLPVDHSPVIRGEAVVEIPGLLHGLPSLRNPYLQRAISYG